MGTMQQTRGNRKQTGATRAQRISLDSVEQNDTLDLRMLEAMERIERLRSKALMAVGTLLAPQR
jgi:hypothetical protein